MPRPIDLIPGFGPKREVECLDDGTFKVTVTPPAMFELPPQSIVLSAKQFAGYKRWQETGALIQNCLPDLSAAEREVLMSGLGNEDFHNIFADEDNC